MQQCPNCGQINRAGVIFCELCGASLIGKQPLDTKSLDPGSEAASKEYGVDADAFADVRAQGTTTFGEGDRLRLEIEGSQEPLFFTMTEEAVFGRKDPATGAMPDIDLTPFAGYRMGVSRRHAAISRHAAQGLDVRDLGSSNGTYLNGQQLAAHRLYRLRNGDELRLGQMVIRVFFEPAQALPPAPSKEEAPASTVAETPAQTLTTQRPKHLADASDAAEAAAGAQAQKTTAAEEKASPQPKDEAAAKSASPAPAQAAPAGEERRQPDAQPSAAAQPKAEDTKAEDTSAKPKTPPDKSESSEPDKRD